jgi:hypothetical protein
MATRTLFSPPRLQVCVAYPGSSADLVKTGLAAPPVVGRARTQLPQLVAITKSSEDPLSLGEV